MNLEELKQHLLEQGLTEKEVIDVVTTYKLNSPFLRVDLSKESWNVVKVGTPKEMLEDLVTEHTDWDILINFVDHVGYEVLSQYLMMNEKFAQDYLFCEDTGRLIRWEHAEEI